MSPRSACLAAVVALAGCAPTPVRAATQWRRVVLVELFTSQGCSSCPPADTFVREMPSLGLGRDKVAPLTFHVDYWDGLGWKDPFATRELTARQEWYARLGRLRGPDGDTGISGLYTPQLVVDGAIHLSGQRRQQAIREIGRAAERAPAFELRPRVALEGASADVAVDVAARADVRRELDWRLVVVLAAKSASTLVTHGENAGEKLEEAAVVRALSPPAPLPSTPRATVHVRVTKPADLAWSDVEIVAFAQAQKTGEIGAAVVSR
jgi:hypothetical protein